jgi:hypothetical protein
MLDKDTVRSIHKIYSGGTKHNNNGENLGFGFIHYALIRNLRPSRILVVGSQRGYIPAIVALACRDENKGHVDFVDAGYDASEANNWGGVGAWKEVNADYWKPLGLEDWITLHVCRTQDFQPHPEGYGYIYIDGDHSYEGVKHDYETFWPWLSLGGFMAFHDVCVDKESHYGNFGVKKFWKEIAKDEHLTIDLSSGLGLLKKCTNTVI